MQSRRVEVDAGRSHRWIAGFAERHGPPETSVDERGLLLRAPDGSQARLDVPFPPLQPDPEDACHGACAHALRSRRVGVVLVRRGGFAVGVVDGGRLVASKAGSRHVQGRAAAGGWSQQRFARRREGQARVAFGAAADEAARVVLPEAARLDAVVVGGDRAAVDAVLADPRLAPLAAKVTEPALWDVPEPRRRVLEEVPRRLRALRVTVSDPPG